MKTILALPCPAAGRHPASRRAAHRAGDSRSVACDAVMAYIHHDSKAWLATLVRPIYGEEGNKAYADFQQQMVASTDKAKEDQSFVPPRILRCFKAASSA
ncbi:MAG: hypothetical protein WDN28_32690 [Chthoniobacter sp.]